MGNSTDAIIILVADTLIQYNGARRKKTIHLEARIDRKEVILLTIIVEK